MKFNLFRGTVKCPVSICYEYYKPESNRIIVYNNSPHSVKSAEITLKNSSNKSFHFKEDHIGRKSNSLIDFNLRNDNNGMKFTGDLAEVHLKCSAGNFKFSPQSGKFFTFL
jgi:hypothetical protein